MVRVRVRFRVRVRVRVKVRVRVRERVRVRCVLCRCISFDFPSIILLRSLKRARHSNFQIRVEAQTDWSPITNRGSRSNHNKTGMVMLSNQRHLKRKNNVKEDFQRNQQGAQSGVRTNKQEEICVFCCVIILPSLCNKRNVVIFRVGAWFGRMLFGGRIIWS